MSGYLLSVIAAALIVGVIGALVPSGEGDGLKKCVCFIGALCVLCLLISPLGQLRERLDSIGESIGSFFDREAAEREYEAQYREYLLSFGADSITLALREHICERFDISSENCHIRVETGEREGELCVTQVTVVLSGVALFCDPHEIEDYIGELFGCRCSVVG